MRNQSTRRKANCRNVKKAPPQRAWLPAHTVIKPVSLDSVRDGGKIGCPFKIGEDGKGTSCTNDNPGACEDCPVFLKLHPKPVLSVSATPKKFSVCKNAIAHK